MSGATTPGAGRAGDAVGGGLRLTVPVTAVPRVHLLRPAIAAAVAGRPAGFGPEAAVAREVARVVAAHLGSPAGGHVADDAGGRRPHTGEAPR